MSITKLDARYKEQDPEPSRIGVLWKANLIPNTYCATGMMYVGSSVLPSTMDAYVVQ